MVLFGSKIIEIECPFFGLNIYEIGYMNGGINNGLILALNYNKNTSVLKMIKLFINISLELNTINSQSQTNIKHLNNEKIELKQELNEAVIIYLQQLKKDNFTIGQLKLKYKTEFDKLCNEFLQSLGTEDINSVTKTLKIK